MTSITPGMARVTDTLQIASRFAHAAGEPPAAATFGPPAQGGDYYERMLSIDMRENWPEVFEALRTIVRPMDIAKITQAELGKHIDYFEWDISRGYYQGKIFIGEDKDRVTSSPAEYLGWLKARVTPETGRGVEVPFDQMREAAAKLQTDDERQEFLKRNGLRLENAMVLFRPEEPEKGPKIFEPARAHLDTSEPTFLAQNKFTDLSADEWRSMLQLIQSLRPSDWETARLSGMGVA